MKKIIANIAFLLMSLNMFSANVDTMADSAQNCFMQTRYAEALDLYDSICGMGYSSSDLYYNMGNCYYRLNEIPYSVYYYEKALMLDPSNSDAAFNLNIANRSLKQVVEAMPKPFYERWGDSLLGLMGTDAWTVFNIIMLVLVLVGIALYLFMGNIALRKLGFSVAFVALVFFVITAVCAYKSSVRIKKNNYAVVFEQSMVKSSPNADAVNSFEICEGLKVQVVDSANGQLNIRLADGKEGWIDANDVKLLAD
ncbi:MAG: tetratricopeptide repeat protein [Bacteroidales bacterium]|nr:tetratricopeptide repeat protein [Bacteroidales bacterium]